MLVLAFGGMMLYSCGDSTTTTPPDTTKHIDTFSTKMNFTTTYDQYEVDTSNASGSDPDVLLASTKVTVTERVIDTNATFAGKTHVSVIVSSNGSTSDTLRYWQDATSGDIYRYNYGVAYINSFAYLVAFIGAPVDIKWVRVYKADAVTNESWVAAIDTVSVSALGTQAFLLNTATRKADTTILVGTENITCKHIQILGTGSLTYNVGVAITVTGRNVADTYISTKYGSTVWDYFRSSTTSTSPNFAAFNYKARGYSKIMKTHS